MEITKEAKARFMAKVKTSPETGCWEWQASTIKNGYGRVGYGRKLHLAHRFSYYIHVGHVPDNLCVLHKCDNRKCVNPAHLFLGTYQDNVDDMFQKGRNIPLKGERNGRSKLTDADILTIRASRGVVTQREMAKSYGVAKSLIQRIVDNQAWTHVKGSL